MLSKFAHSGRNSDHSLIQAGSPGRLIRTRTALAAGLVATASLGALVLLPVAPAGAATTTALPTSLQRFKNCPIDNPAVILCVSGSMTGTFTIGSQSLTTPKPATLTLGLGTNAQGLYAIPPDNGTSALSSPPIPVTILGLPPLPGVLSITATPTLLSTPSISLTNILDQSGPAVSLNLDVQLNNALLGPSCTIGSPTSPISLNLTTGTTTPPAGVTPLQGSKGVFTQKKDGEIIDSGLKIVDNDFVVPGANGCGLFGILDPILNTIEGLPSAAGKNSAVFSGSNYLIPANTIRKYLG
jgi:hypothetical protein